MAERVRRGREGDARLEAELRALARELEWPQGPAPGVLEAAAAAAAAAGAGARPARAPLRAWPRAWPRPAARAALVVAALALAAGIALAVPPARTGLLDLLGLEGVSLVRVARLPPLAPSGTAVLRGERVSLAEARRRAAFPVALPALGPPDAVVLDAGTGGVALTWGSPVRLRLVEIPMGVVIEKIAASSTGVRAVEVDGAPGAWLSGSPHAVLGIFVQPALAGDTLLWERHGVTYRLDGRIGLEQALRIARSVR